MQSLQGAPVVRIVAPVTLHQHRGRDFRNLSWRFAEHRWCGTLSAKVRVLQSGGGKRESGQLVVRCVNDDELFLDDDAPAPPYTSYIDPVSGEPAPTYGFRPKIPRMEYWGEEVLRDVRAAEGSVPRRGRRMPDTGSSDGRRARTSKRKQKAEEARVGAEVAQVAAVGVGVGVAEAVGPDGRRPNPFLEDSDDEEEEEEEGQGSGDQEEGASQDGAGENREPRPEDYQLVVSDKSSLGEQMKDLIEPAPDSPLKNDELWWNWRRPEPGQEPWSAWQRRMGDPDTVMASAMAKSGQIKLFGDKPTIAEATLARARKRVFKEQRLQAEEERKNKIGAMAYYQEWVKAWRRDTSLEAVKKREEETGDNLSSQLLEMFSHQTREEYRIMMGTDIRIKRDPLVMRMSDEEKKQVYGGDPVYPTINYVQDPNCVADYRGANFHEPTPDIIEFIRQEGRLITREELQRIQELEKAQDEEEGIHDDGMSGAVDIGDKDDEDEDDDESEEHGRTASLKATQEPVKDLLDTTKEKPVEAGTLDEDDLVDEDMVVGDDADDDVINI